MPGLIYHEDDSNVIWSLQAADAEVPSFIVIDPFTIVPDYRPELSKADLAGLGETDFSSLCFLVIAVIKPELSESVVNLKAPLVININTNQARQIILEDSDYPIRYKLFADRKQEDAGCL
ncbi:MAG: flagellar assembly protein FliW [Clostridiales bacterium]|nr:flagellar assembly protein FliW [Clostridiales bacterium]